MSNVLREYRSKNRLVYSLILWSLFSIRRAYVLQWSDIISDSTLNQKKYLKIVIKNILIEQKHSCIWPSSILKFILKLLLRSKYSLKHWYFATSRKLLKHSLPSITTSQHLYFTIEDFSMLGKDNGYYPHATWMSPSKKAKITTIIFTICEPLWWRIFKIIDRLLMIHHALSLWDRSQLLLIF